MFVVLHAAGGRSRVRENALLSAFSVDHTHEIRHGINVHGVLIAAVVVAALPTADEEARWLRLCDVWQDVPFKRRYGRPTCARYVQLVV